MHILCLPAHCSHLLQPLDVGVFKPAKDEWRKIIKSWYKESRRKAFDKGQFTKLLKVIYANSMKVQHVLSGFAKCVIFPFDPTAIALDKLAPVATFDIESLETSQRTPTGGHLDTSPGTRTDEAVADQSTFTIGPDTNLGTLSGSREEYSDQSMAHTTPVATSHVDVSHGPLDTTPRRAMAKAVFAQLKLCNAAVRQKTTKRKISKQFGGECLTEEEGVA